MHDFGEQRCACRGFLGRLHHNTIAARQRRRDLPGQQQKRQIPRGDDSHHAERFSHGVVKCGAPIGGLRTEGFQRRSLNQISEDSKVCSTARNIDLGRERHWFSRIRYFRGNKFLKSCFYSIRDFLHKRRPFWNRKRSPFTQERRACGVDGLIYLGAVRFRYLRDDRAIRGIYIGKFPRASDESAVNVVLEYLHRIARR